MTLIEQTRSKLLDMIRDSDINTKLPSERKLSELYGISRTTVVKVVETLEMEGYVKRKPGSGTYVAPRDTRIGYLNDVISGTPRVRGEVVIVFPNYAADTVWSMVTEAEMLAVKNNVKLNSVKLQPQSDYTCLLNLAEHADRLLGIIIIPSGDLIPGRVLSELSAYHVPVVILEKMYDCQGIPHVHRVCGDHFQLGYMMMSELLDNGHRRIGYVANEPWTPSTKERLRGVKQALYDRRLLWKSIIKSPLENSSWHSAMDIGYEATLQLLKTNPSLTGIFYDTFPGAFSGLAAAHRLGFRCPDDLSVIATSGLFGCERYTIPAVTTVDYDIPTLTDIAFDIILHPAKEHQKNILTNVRINRRNSIGKVSL